MGPDSGLPPVNTISMFASLGWLTGGWRDLWKAPATFLTYGLAMAFLCGVVSLALVASGMALWAVILAAGFVFVAPLLAMGMYEGGRLIETGQRPTLSRISFVRSAFRSDVAFLGLVLFFIFGVWAEMAQITYGLATNRLYPTLDALIAFAINAPAGNGMLFWGSIIGGIMAWLTFCIVVVSAPMLLDRRRDFFVAIVTSVRCVVRNTLPMMVWAAIIATLILLSVATGFAGLIIVFPWLGLASWRAYRSLVKQSVS